MDSSPPSETSSRGLPWDETFSTMETQILSLSREAQSQCTPSSPLLFMPRSPPTPSLIITPRNRPDTKTETPTKKESPAAKYIDLVSDGEADPLPNSKDAIQVGKSTFAALFPTSRSRSRATTPALPRSLDEAISDTIMLLRTPGFPSKVFPKIKQSPNEFNSAFSPNAASSNLASGKTTAKSNSTSATSSSHSGLRLSHPFALPRPFSLSSLNQPTDLLSSIEKDEAPSPKKCKPINKDWIAGFRKRVRSPESEIPIRRRAKRRQIVKAQRPLCAAKISRGTERPVRTRFERREKPSFLKPISNIVQIKLGPNIFMVYGDFLDWYCPTLAETCRDARGVITPHQLADVNVEVFGLFVQWLYSQSLYNKHDQPAYQDRLMALWVLARRLGMPQLQNDAIDVLEERRRLENCIQIKGFKYVWANSARSDMMRRYLVEVCARPIYTFKPEDIEQWFPREMVDQIEEIKLLEEEDGVDLDMGTGTGLGMGDEVKTESCHVNVHEN